MILPLSARNAAGRRRAAQLAADVATVKAAKEKEDSERREKIAAERAAAAAARTPVTRGDLDGAKYVRTRYRWHKIVRVNAKTVSVETGYSWVDRILFEDLWDVRK